VKNARVGDQELEVLRYVADNGPVTVGQAAEGYGAPRGLARSTILTVMERLRAKGYLTRVRRGGVFQYVSKDSGDNVMRDLVASFVQRSLSGSLSPFTAYLAEATDVSDEDLAELQSTLARLQKQRGVEVP
jgi:predicted transcriptional regulator